MANLTSKIYEIRNSTTDEVVCVAILQFSEHTNVKHWSRIAEKIRDIFHNPVQSTNKQNWSYSDLVTVIEEYVSQHRESGFNILIHWTGGADYIIRI